MRPRGQQHGVYTMCVHEAQAPSWAEYLMWIEHGDTDWPALKAASEEEAEAESEGESARCATSVALHMACTLGQCMKPSDAAATCAWRVCTRGVHTPR